MGEVKTLSRAEEEGGIFLSLFFDFLLRVGVPAADVAAAAGIVSWIWEVSPVLGGLRLSDVFTGALIPLCTSAARNALPVPADKLLPCLELTVLIVLPPSPPLLPLRTVAYYF